jgi:hypothetical protein
MRRWRAGPAWVRRSAGRDAFKYETTSPQKPFASRPAGFHSTFSNFCSERKSLGCGLPG